jgi:hypothetical protein
MGSSGVRQPYRPPAIRPLWVGFCGGSGTGLSVLNPWELSSQLQMLARTGSVAVIARASTTPAITMIFDFMGRLLLRDEDPDNRISTTPAVWPAKSLCGCDGHHKKHDNVSTIDLAYHQLICKCRAPNSPCRLKICEK